MFNKLEHMAVMKLQRELVRSKGAVRFMNYCASTHTCQNQFGLKVQEYNRRRWTTIAKISFATEKVRTVVREICDSVLKKRELVKLSAPI